MLTLLVSLIIGAPTPPQELYDYLAKPDASFSYHIVKQDHLETEIDMTSQTWQGMDWKHTILLQQPSSIEFPHTGILYITGDGPKPGDLLDLALVTQSTGMPVAMLFDVPNQPIDGRKEDDLIAHTFEQYLQKPDPTIPLLFPMTKSAIRAMDAVQELTKNTDNPITKFVVAGASKRGWTTWMVGAANDPRVKGIAPMVIDNLNIPAQMKHQIETWGKYSDMIQDYTRRGLQAQLATPEGHSLGVLIDPYSYRANIKAPTLIVKGANDPYWTADALDMYWNDLKEPKWLLTVPNAGHTLGNGLMAVASIGAFARSIAGEFKMPILNWDYSEANGSARLTVKSKNPPMAKLILWVAESDSLDFRESEYRAASTASTNFKSLITVQGTPIGSGSCTVDYKLPTDKNVAMFGEMQYTVDGHEFSLSTPTKIFKMQPSGKR